MIGKRFIVFVGILALLLLLLINVSLGVNALATGSELNGYGGMVVVLLIAMVALPSVVGLLRLRQHGDVHRALIHATVVLAAVNIVACPYLLLSAVM